MYFATMSISSGDVSKSGKPCDRLIAPTSFARRVITAKMLTPPAGSFDRMACANDIESMIPVARATHASPLPALQEIVGLQGHKGVFVAKFHNTIVVAHLRDFLAHQAIAQPPQLEAIEVADELVHDLRPGGGRRLDSVPRQLIEHLGAIAIRRHRGVAGP